MLNKEGMKRQEFISRAEKYLNSPENISIRATENNKINKQVALAKTYFDKYELAIQRTAYLKNKALENSDKLLANFEFNLNNTKVKVIWATDAVDALKEIADISKELSLPVYFDEVNVIKEVEKEIGNAGHHIPRADKQSNQYIGLTKADFIVADSSSIVCLNHDKHSTQMQGKAKAQIFIAGIDALIQSFNDIELIASLQSTNKYGEPIHANICIYNGNKLNEDDALKEDLFVILLDNGRTQILSDHEQRSILNCIHCEACKRACPVTLFAGENAYGTIYSGPHGALVSHHIENNEDATHLAFASTLCSKCNDVCPMNIDLSAFMAYSRRNAVKNKQVSKTENLTIYFWKNAVMKRSNMDKGGAKVKAFMFKQILRKAWGSKREMPVVATKSFNQLWRERKDFG
jgi:L-lactate dehydrogenase complex protein LldF